MLYKTGDTIMKLTILFSSFFVVLCSMPQTLQAADKSDESKEGLIATLQDGSKIIGTVTLDKISIKAEGINAVKIPIRKIRRIVFHDGQKDQTVFLINGDRLTGTLDISKLTMQTLIGNITIPLKVVVSLKRSTLNGLEAQYSFNGNARDSSGNEVNGTVHGATLCEDRHGNKNSAYKFDGVDDYIKFGKKLPDMEKMTISAWVCAENNLVWLSDADWFGGNDVTIQCGPSSVFLRADKGSYSLCDKIDVGVDLLNQWRHITWTMTPKQSDTYIDGKHCGRIKKGGSNVGFHDFILGTMEYPKGRMGWLGYWKGKISNLKIYSRVLSSNDIREIYEQND